MLAKANRWIRALATGTANCGRYLESIIETAVSRQPARPAAMCFLISTACIAGWAATPHLGGAQPQQTSRVRARSHPVPVSSRNPARAWDAERLSSIERVITAAIADGELAGAVVVAGTSAGEVYRAAFGRRAVEPTPEPMTEDTIFDLASLTKIVATTMSVMMLVEEGRLRLNDRVSDHIPELTGGGKEKITLLHLLTHKSGFRPDLDLDELWEGAATAMERAMTEVLVAEPDERFVYSDINFLLLGEIVERVGGVPLERFAAERVFEPLGMTDTTFRPSPALLPRIAPTERCAPLAWPCAGSSDPPLRGVVHDPTARRMGGVAGHAGLFSTAADLARFCRMILNGGTLDERRVLSPLGVERMTSRATPIGDENVRGLGWDIDSMYSTNRGDLFPVGSFGHTGFTGTSIWIDPSHDAFIVFLSSRLHPDGRGDVTELRGRIASIVAAALPGRRAPLGMNDGTAPSVRTTAGGSVLTGVDVWEADDFAALRGRRVGLLTNHTGRNRLLVPTVDLLHGAGGLTLAMLFSPEHGIRGVLDENVPSSTDDATGLTIHSLYGEHRRPLPSMFDGIDTIVLDLQDVGARFYTYMTTMAYVMEAAARHGLRVVVFDRPNPITGTAVEGPVQDESVRGFTGYFPMPIRHGLTFGELARLFAGELKLNVDLEVVTMRGWRRELWFDETGLPWANPSPNIRNLNGATLYPGIGAIEGTNLSVGRGTDAPFEQIGAPWIDGVQLAELLNARSLPGIRFYPTTFTPTSSKYAGQVCQGVHMIVTDREALRPVRVGLEIAVALHRAHGADFDLDAAHTLLGSKTTIERLKAGDDPADIAASWRAGEEAWRRLTAKYLLY